MYHQIEERKILMVKNLLHFLSVDVNQNNINNMNNILTEFNKMDTFPILQTLKKPKKNTTNEWMMI